MAFNIQDFRSSLRYDGARPNLFEVSMSTINVGVANIDPQMVFKCRAAQLPEDNLGVIPVNYMGREIKIPGNRTFPEWTVTVINDEDFLVRNSLECKFDDSACYGLITGDGEWVESATMGWWGLWVLR